MFIYSRKKNLKDAYNRLKEQDSIYTSISKKLLDYQNTISSIEVTNFMFHVVRLGSLYESNTDVKSLNLDGFY